RSVGEVGSMTGLQFLCSNGQRAINTVAARMHADGVAPGGVGNGADDGPAQLRIARPPHHRRGRLAALGRVSVQSYVSHMLSRCRKAGKRGILGPVGKEEKPSERAIFGTDA